MRRLVCAIGLGMALALVADHLEAQTTDPVIGTWELNVAKSKFSPGPAPKSESRTYVAAGAEIKTTTKVVDATGKTLDGGFTINYDSKETPVTGNADFDTLSLKRIDPYSTEFTLKQKGKVVSTGTRVISKDGKVMTITTKGTNAKGQQVNDVAVYEKR